LDRFYKALRDYGDVEAQAIETLKPSSWYQRFVASMNDDFNTREAFAVMYDLVRELNTATSEQRPDASQLAVELKSLGAVLGLLNADAEQFLQGTDLNRSAESDGISDQQIDTLIADREAAKTAKNYGLADEIREQLLAQGIVLEDSRDGTRWRRD
ncbi:MAG: cysteine--tRNA ligase, partial [Porticoccaceae bacterium]|nr:cysteine--tRNA ligase [Porticoccaceae bacterium]